MCRLGAWARAFQAVNGVVMTSLGGLNSRAAGKRVPDPMHDLTGWARRQLADARRLRAQAVVQRRRVERMGAELRAVAS